MMPPLIYVQTSPVGTEDLDSTISPHQVDHSKFEERLPNVFKMVYSQGFEPGQRQLWVRLGASDELNLLFLKMG